MFQIILETFEYKIVEPNSVICGYLIMLFVNFLLIFYDLINVYYYYYYIYFSTYLGFYCYVLFSEKYFSLNVLF